MTWVHEVSMYLFTDEGKHAIIYQQFDRKEDAIKFATSLYDGAYPTQSVEVRIRVNPQN